MVCVDGARGIVPAIAASDAQSSSLESSDVVFAAAMSYTGGPYRVGVAPGVVGRTGTCRCRAILAHSSPGAGVTALCGHKMAPWARSFKSRAPLATVPQFAMLVDWRPGCWPPEVLASVVCVYRPRNLGAEVWILFTSVPGRCFLNLDASSRRF